MWPRRSDTLCVGVSNTQVAWQCAGSPPQLAPLSNEAGRFERIAESIEASTLPARLAAVHVVAGSSVARHWLQTAPPGLRSLSELQALVQSRADQLFGGDGSWVVAADWHASLPFLCVALPREVAGLASALAQPRRSAAHLASSLGLTMSRHAQQVADDGWTVVHEPEALHLVYLSAGRLQYARTATVGMGLQALALEREVSAEVDRSAALAGGLPTGPLTVLPFGQDAGTSQADAALRLALRNRSDVHP